MKAVQISTIILFSFFLSACGSLNIYKNAHEPIDRTGKEDWGLISVEEGPIGSILISPRPRENALSALASTGNHLARSQILLEPGLRDINVYAFNGNKTAMFVIQDINIKANEEYTVRYEVNNNRVNARVVNNKEIQPVNETQSKCPLLEGMRASVQMTREAIQARHNGQTKDQLESNIPSVASRLPWAAVLMQSILDEVYSTEETLEPDVHAAYRMEICFLLDQHPDSEPSLNFEQAYPLLKKCSSDDKGAQTRCSMEVAHRISGIPE